MQEIALILILFLLFKDCSGSTAIKELKEPVEKIGKELHTLNLNINTLIQLYKSR